MKPRFLSVCFKILLSVIVTVLALPVSQASTAADSVLSYLPTYDWHTFYGGYEHDVAIDFVQDSAGNIYTTGQSCGDWTGLTPLHTGIFGDIMNMSCNLFVAKYSKDGAYIWHTFYGSAKGTSAVDIALDSSGNITVVGSSGGEWVEVKAPRRAHSGGGDLFILKLSSQGAYQWHTFYGSANEESVAGLAVSDNGNLLITGNSCGQWINVFNPLHEYGGDCSLFVLKTDLNGAYQWHTFYGTASGYTNSSGIQLDSSGNVFVAGYSRGVDGLTPLNAHSNPTGDRYSYDVLVLKLNSSGSYQWHTFYGSKEYENSTAITLDGSGNVYVTGFSDGDWEGMTPRHPFTQGQNRSRNLLVFKLDTQGTYHWHTFYENSSANDLVVDQRGLLHIIGAAYEWTALEPDNPYTMLTDTLLLSLDYQGNYVRHSYFGSADDDNGVKLGWGGSGNLIVVGLSYNTWPGKNPLHGRSGQADMYILNLTMQEVLVHSTSISIAVNRNPVPAGYPVQITAAVTSNGGMPNGKVEFRDGSSIIGSALLLNGIASLEATFLTEGSHAISATYKGSRNFFSSTTLQTLELQSVKAETKTTIQINPLEPKGGEPVTLMAVVSAADENNETPMGSVTFKGGSAVLGTSNLSGGIAQLTVNFSAPGSYPITAEYSGNQTFLPSTSVVKGVNVVKGIVTLHLDSQPIDGTPYGEPVTVNATVLSGISGSLLPTGTVTFKEGNTVLGTSSLMQGKASLTLPVQLPGQHSITAEYSSSDLYYPSEPVMVTLTITKLTPTLKLDISAGKAFRPEQETDLTVTVRQPAPGNPIPTGSVTFYDREQEMGTLDLQSGAVTMSNVKFTKGIHVINAVYSGDCIYAASTTLVYKVLVTDNWSYLPLLQK